MTKLLLPPVAEVEGIVLDMMPNVAPHASPEAVRLSVEAAEELVSLFTRIDGNPIAAVVLQAMLTGMLPCPECSYADEDGNLRRLH